MCVYISIYTRVYMYMCKCICTHTYTHTHILAVILQDTIQFNNFMFISLDMIENSVFNFVK